MTIGDNDGGVVIHSYPGRQPSPDGGLWDTGWRSGRPYVGSRRIPASTVGDVTASTAFEVLIRDHLGPDLRELRWKGSGANWLRPHPTHWVLLGWQKSSSSNAASVRFTGNLKVIAKDEWDAENLPRGRVPERPSTAMVWDVGWEHRLGDLIPDSGGDRWWSVRPGDDLSGIARAVIGALTTYGLPAVERELAAAEEQPRWCWHNSGGRNWFQPCGRSGDVALESDDRVTYRCAEHADVMPEQTSPAH